MENNLKILISGIVMIVIVTLLCLGASLFLALDDPVFFLNYVEDVVYSYSDQGAPVESDGSETVSELQKKSFALQYVTNASDNRTLSGISFPEEPLLTYITDTNGVMGMVFFNEGSATPGNTYGVYSVRTVYFDINAIEKIPEEGIRLTKAIVQYDNGDRQTVDLGKIILYPEDTGKHGVLQTVGGSSSSDGTVTDDRAALRDVVITKVDLTSLEDAADKFKLTVDDEDFRKVNGKQYKDGATIRIKGLINPIEDALGYNRYAILPALHYQDNEGNQYLCRIYNLDYNPSNSNPYTFFGLIKYLHGRGEI